MSTQAKAKKSTNKKRAYGKKKKVVTVSEKPEGKKKLYTKRKIYYVVEDVEEDVEDNQDNIMVLPLKKNRKIISGKKIPTNFSISPLENVSFQSEESVMKWKYVYHRRITPERELSKEALTCENIVDLLEDA